ncbi:MAG TPA: hypothetical protein VHG51_03105 [Longimicrobiaceae bacterium]|nr:hypothetical protein [Longimicrobiaceae bacterium]
MQGNRSVPFARLRGDRRGVALPLALFGLVAITIMVTAVLMTSTTEAAMSNANLDATRTLYAAEGAVQAYVASQGAGLTAVTDLDWQIPGTTEQARINVVRLGRIPGNVTVVPPFGPTDRYSVTAEPLVNGRPGRGVVAMVSLPSTFTNMDLNVNSGATVGSDLNVGGNSKVVDRSTACSDTTGSAAVTHADGTNVTTSGSGTISGAVQESQFSGTAFVDWVLNGRTLEEFARVSQIKFGPMLDAQDFPSNARAQWNATDTRMRWGCPTGVGINCSAAGADTLKYPSIAVDAKGGAIDLQGDHGQGVLIVMNGSLKISGNFMFKGIIIVEGYTEITGTGGKTTSKIEGALVSLGQNTSERTRIDESQTKGNAVISYNRCQVESAQEAFNKNQLENPTFQPPQASFAWYELIR